MRRFGVVAFVGVAAFVALTAACGEDDDSAATSTTTTASAASTTAVPTTTPAPARAAQVVYFLHDATVDHPQPFLVPVDLGGEASLADTLTALLAGPPTTDEVELASPAFGTQIPRGTRLLGVDVSAGVATIDLAGDFEDGGGSATMFARLAQVVYTATRYPDVTDVALLLDGAPVGTFSSEGIELGGSIGREFFDGVGVLPRIFVDEPAWSAEATTPLRLAGRARDVGPGGIQWAVTDGDMTVAAGAIDVTGAGWHDFSADIVVDPGGRVATLEVFEIGPDGGTLDLIEYPLIGREAAAP